MKLASGKILRKSDSAIKDNCLKQPKTFKGNVTVPDLINLYEAGSMSSKACARTRQEMAITPSDNITGNYPFDANWTRVPGTDGTTFDVRFL